MRGTSIQGGNQTYMYIEHIGNFIMGVNLFNGTTLMQKNIVLKINTFWLYEISWITWQPIMRL